MTNDSDAKAQWVSRVLGFEVPRAAARRGPVAYAKLLLRWREAQNRVAENLRALAAATVALEEVRADPRFPQVQQAVAALPELVPEFGGELEDLIDRAMTLGATEQATEVEEKAIGVLAEYRRKLAAATALAKLEGFAARHVGSQPRLYQELDEALAALDQELKVRVR